MSNGHQANIYVLQIPYREAHITYKQKCVTDNSELSDIIDAQVNMVISSFPATDKQLVKFANETKNDPMLHAVMKCILYGCKNGQCPAYASFKDELCIINGIIFRGSRIVVPASMRNEMLCSIHEGHLGIDKQKNMSRNVLYWPNMNVDIEKKSQNCTTCLKYRPAQCKESYYEDHDVLGPWSKVGTDIFHWRGVNYILVIDYYSN